MQMHAPQASYDPVQVVGQAMTVQRIVVFGCGLWGANIVRDLRVLGARVDVVDPDPRAQRTAVELGARSAPALMPGAADGVVIASPASAHLANVEAALTLDCPLLIEKPLADSAAAAEAMVDRIQAQSRDAHMVDVWRYHGAVGALTRMVADRTVGEVRGLCSQRANWTSPRTDVDTLTNLGPHEISLYRQIFAAEPRAQAAHFEAGNDGSVVSAWTRLGPAPWLISELSNRSPVRVRTLRLHGTDGVALWDADRPSQVLLASGPADGRLEASVRLIISVDAEPALRAQLRAWLAFLDGAPPPLTDLQAGLASMQLIQQLRAFQSAP